MRTLTNEQLDNLIKRSDEIYDKFIRTGGDSPTYHEICCTLAICRGYATDDDDYDSDIIDNRCLEISYDGDYCDYELDRYSRRFDCEV